MVNFKDLAMRYGITTKGDALKAVYFVRECIIADMERLSTPDATAKDIEDVKELSLANTTLDYLGEGIDIDWDDYELSEDVGEPRFKVILEGDC